MKRAGESLCRAGAAAALVKGGHLSGAIVTDVLVTRDGIEIFESPRIDSTSTHGTGCTLASAIATGIAQKLPLTAAVVRARAYVLEAIRTAPGFGHGHGPLNHGHTVRPFTG
jgi:hydroxymethylpyrimidine/phosphomethylpyrimidine kinase